MDMQKEKDLYLTELFEREVLTHDELNDIEFKHEINAFHSRYLSARFIDNINFGWSAWQAAKASAVPDGFVLVEKKNIENWYLDESESMWMEEPDNWLCDLDIGEVQEVERKEYIVTDNSSLFAAKVWDDENDQLDCWEFFKTKEEAEKAAAYCKTMIEAAQEKGHDQ